MSDQDGEKFKLDLNVCCTILLLLFTGVGLMCSIIGGMWNFLNTIEGTKNPPQVLYTCAFKLNGAETNDGKPVAVLLYPSPQNGYENCNDGTVYKLEVLP